MPADRPLIPFSEAARLAGYSEATLRRWYRAGDLPAGLMLTLNGRYYVRRAALIAWRDTLLEQPERQPDSLRLVEAGGQ